MYFAMRHVGVKKALVVEAPGLAASFMIAEVAYKFGSFTLECAAFLCTWFAFSSIASTLSSLGRTAAGSGLQH